MSPGQIERANLPDGGTVNNTNLIGNPSPSKTKTNEKIMLSKVACYSVKARPAVSGPITTMEK